jgi:hypothetical protein
MFCGLSKLVVVYLEIYRVARTWFDSDSAECSAGFTRTVILQ